MKLTPAQEAEYLKGDARTCPFCNNSFISHDDPESDKGEISQGMYCSCGAHWTNFYTLSRIVVVDEPEDS